MKRMQRRKESLVMDRRTHDTGTEGRVQKGMKT
jgi:hypothetical protein